MVFLVVRNLTPAPHVVGTRIFHHRLAAAMGDNDVGVEEDLSAAGAESDAEIDVLCVHEIALVEQADGFEVLPPGKQAGAADPLALAAGARPLLDASCDRADS